MWLGIICLVGLIALILSIIFLVKESDLFGLWITIFFISLGLVFFGGIGAATYQSVEESENAIVQEGSTEDNSQYNYCPYCGKELK